MSFVACLLLKHTTQNNLSTLKNMVTKFQVSESCLFVNVHGKPFPLKQLWVSFSEVSTSALFLVALHTTSVSL